MRPSRRPASAAGVRARRCARRALRRWTAGSRRPPASRSGYPAISRPRSCNSTGARRSAERSVPRSTPSSTAGEQRLAEPLGAAVARRWARIGVGADLVTHVPVHAARARTRGYDQAELIARVAARHLGLPYATLVTRERATIAQFDLDRSDRAANVAGAFVAGSGRGDRPVGRWVLLVDDVVTTGATLAACAEALERAGALGTSAITVARER